MLNVEFRVDNDYRMTAIINGVEFKRNNNIGGCRNKFTFEAEGKQYFMKVDSFQTKGEIEVIAKAYEEGNGAFFIPIIQHGEFEYQVRGRTYKNHYLIQERVEFDKPWDVEPMLWPQVREVAKKYGLLWDLCDDFVNWACLAGTTQPVIYDAGRGSDSEDDEDGW